MFLVPAWLSLMLLMHSGLQYQCQLEIRFRFSCSDSCKAPMSYLLRCTSHFFGAVFLSWAISTCGSAKILIFAVTYCKEWIFPIVSKKLVSCCPSFLLFLIPAVSGVYLQHCIGINSGTVFAPRPSEICLHFVNWYRVSQTSCQAIDCPSHPASPVILNFPSSIPESNFFHI